MLKTEDLELEITFIWSSTILPLQNCYLLKGLLCKLVINKSGYTKTEEAENKSHESFHSLIVVKGFSSFKSILNSLSSIFLFFFPLIFPAENQIINKQENSELCHYPVHFPSGFSLDSKLHNSAYCLDLSLCNSDATNIRFISYQKKNPTTTTQKKDKFFERMFFN